MKKIFLVLFVILHITTINAQEDNSRQVELIIDQNIFGSYTQHSFSILNSKLFIYETKVLKSGSICKKKIYTKKLKPAYVEKTITLVNNLQQLDDEYIKAQLGGVRFTIETKYEKNTKTIIIENYSISEINNLFKHINRVIPRRKPKLLTDSF